MPSSMQVATAASPFPEHKSQPALRLLLIRHAETEHNIKGLLAGVTDSRLTSHGALQAQRLADHLVHARRLVFSHVYSSDLVRARETADRVWDAHLAARHRDDAEREQLLQLAQINGTERGVGSDATQHQSNAEDKRNGADSKTNTKSNLLGQRVILKALREQNFGSLERQHPGVLRVDRNSNMDHENSGDGINQYRADFEPMETPEAMRQRTESFVREHIAPLLDAKIAAICPRFVDRDENMVRDDIDGRDASEEKQKMIERGARTGAVDDIYGASAHEEAPTADTGRSTEPATASELNTERDPPTVAIVSHGIILGVLWRSLLSHFDRSNVSSGADVQAKRSFASRSSRDDGPAGGRPNTDVGPAVGADTGTRKGRGREATDLPRHYSTDTSSAIINKTPFWSNTGYLEVEIHAGQRIYPDGSKVEGGTIVDTTPLETNRSNEITGSASKHISNNITSTSNITNASSSSTPTQPATIASNTCQVDSFPSNPSRHLEPQPCHPSNQPLPRPQGPIHPNHDVPSPISPLSSSSIHMPTPISQRLPMERYPYMHIHIDIKSINAKDHLIGLKRTGGGLGSSAVDGKQRKLEKGGFFLEK